MKGFRIIVFWLLCLAFSFVFSIITFFLFYIITIKTAKLHWTDFKRKSVLAITGLIATLLPLAFVFGHDEEYKDTGTLKLIFAYCLTTVLGIYFYNLKSSTPKE